MPQANACVEWVQTAVVTLTAGPAICRRSHNPRPPHNLDGRYLVRLSYLQIYNEVISDLLKPERTNLVIR